MAQTQSSNLDGLPKGFVLAMRTLFDIMDDDRSGFVKFIDIEERWQDDGNQGLPEGVLESLKKVTPSNGLLSFDRFCTGLKLSLLNIKTDNEDNNNRKSNDVVQQQQQQQQQQQHQQQQQPNRPPSAPVNIVDNNNQNKIQWSSQNTATIRPNNAISQQRTLSMPQLHSVIRKEVNLSSSDITDNRNVNDQINKSLKIVSYGPPKPPRIGAAAAAATASSAVGIDGRNQSTMNFERNIDKSEIRTALQNWQMGLMMGDDNKIVDKNRQQIVVIGGSINYHQNDNAARNLIQSTTTTTTMTTTTTTTAAATRALGDGKAVDTQNNQIIVQQKKNLARRREPRRHTLQNGIDYNMMKRMKQIEQEKDVLIQGLTAVDKTREWYMKQISATQDKIKHVGRIGSHVEQWSESQQEKLELQRARVLEVNRHLGALISSWERGGLPLHMNLAVLSNSTTPQLNQEIVTRLKQQNHRLNEEVNKKSQRIAILEQEKDNLMREIYNRQSGIGQQRRSTIIHEPHDQTFII